MPKTKEQRERANAKRNERYNTDENYRKKVNAGRKASYHKKRNNDPEAHRDKMKKLYQKKLERDLNNKKEKKENCLTYPDCRIGGIWEKRKGVVPYSDIEEVDFEILASNLPSSLKKVYNRIEKVNKSYFTITAEQYEKIFGKLDQETKNILGNCSIRKKRATKCSARIKYRVTLNNIEAFQAFKERYQESDFNESQVLNREEVEEVTTINKRKASEGQRPTKRQRLAETANVNNSANCTQESVVVEETIQTDKTCDLAPKNQLAKANNRSNASLTFFAPTDSNRRVDKRIRPVHQIAHLASIFLSEEMRQRARLFEPEVYGLNIEVPLILPTPEEERANILNDLLN